MFNVIEKELTDVVYRNGFAEGSILGAPVIIEAVVGNDDWTTLVIKSDNQSPMTFEGPFENFPSNLQTIIENIVMYPVVENINPTLVERFSNTLDVFSRKLALHA